MRPIAFPSWAQSGLITAVFCCLIALALTLVRHSPWDVNLVYSLSIGVSAWLAIHLAKWLMQYFTYQHEPVLERVRLSATWPLGWRGVLVIAGGIAAGFTLGSWLGDRYLQHRLGQQTEHQSLLFPLVITVLASVAICAFFYSQGRARALQAQTADAQRDAAEAQLNLLATQLEPHMLFNTLANLRVLIHSDTERAETMLDHLIAYLRATLGGSRVTQHALSEEFARLQDYLALMEVRMGTRLRYTLDLPPELADVPVPPLLLQPLVENSIRHGLEPQVAGGHIQVQARSVAHALPDGHKEDWLEIRVQDDGQGLAASARHQPDMPSSHFGTTQVKERLRNRYGSSATFKLIAVSTGGACAIVSFPLHPPNHS